MERYRLQEWLNFITSELHKGFGPLFNPAVPDAYKTMAKERLALRFAWLVKQMEGRDYLMGKTFTVADAYLFTVLGWAQYVQVDLAPFPALGAYLGRVAARPKVVEALKAEGLVS